MTWSQWSPKVKDSIGVPQSQALVKKELFFMFMKSARTLGYSKHLSRFSQLQNHETSTGTALLIPGEDTASKTWTHFFSGHHFFMDGPASVNPNVASQQVWWSRSALTILYPTHLLSTRDIIEMISHGLPLLNILNHEQPTLSKIDHYCSTLNNHW